MLMHLSLYVTYFNNSAYKFYIKFNIKYIYEIKYILLVFLND